MEISYDKSTGSYCINGKPAFKFTIDKKVIGAATTKSDEIDFLTKKFCSQVTHSMDGIKKSLRKTKRTDVYKLMAKVLKDEGYIDEEPTDSEIAKIDAEICKILKLL